MTTIRDVVVVGSGHNALVAACYLAREGLDVEVVEKDTVLGGAVSTVERWPGYQVDRGSSAHIMVRHTGIVEELRLGECGLTYLDMDPWGFAPFGDATSGEQQAITFHVDLDATCASIAALCGDGDAEAYRRFATDWADRNERVFAAFQDRPSPGRLARHLWGIGTAAGSKDGLELSRQFLQPADQLLDEHFADERLKTALSWLGAQSGPPGHEVATADLVGWNTLLHRMPPGRPVGGSGALTAALAERLRRLGGTVRAGDAVTAITRAGDRVTGVVTAGGDRLAARAVVAGCHVLTTLELLGDAALLARARRAVRVGNGLGMVVRLATRDLPRYPSADATSYAAMQLLAPSRAHLRAAYGDFGAGRLPREPAVLVMTPTALDTSIAPAGRHVVTAWAQWHPYELGTGERWDDIRDREGERIVAQVERAAPGFTAGIEQVHVQTPLDLERELGLRRGNVMHVEMGLDSMFAYRPLPELAGYRTPVRGLFLTGASTHPGGGVFGASGRTAARVALAGRRRWR